MLSLLVLSLILLLLFYLFNNIIITSIITTIIILTTTTTTTTTTPTTIDGLDGGDAVHDRGHVLRADLKCKIHIALYTLLYSMLCCNTQHLVR